MTLLCVGLAVWFGAHLFKRVFPETRQALGRAGMALVALLLWGAVVLMVIGYRSTYGAELYTLPGWVWHLNNLAMLIAVFLMGVGRAGGVIGSKIRHPMLTGAIIWAVAHLLVNGDVASVVLFGGMAIWALTEIIVINRAEGAWTPPARGRVANDMKVAVISLALYGAFAGVHYWLGYPVFGMAI